MMGGNHGLMNGKPCWSPSAPQRWDDSWTVKEDAPLNLAQAARIVADAKRRGLIREPKEEKPLTKAQLLASFPAAIEAAIKAGLVQRPPEKHKQEGRCICGSRTRKGKEFCSIACVNKHVQRRIPTKLCGCGATIHFHAKSCTACKKSKEIEKTCAVCSVKFTTAGKAQCCSVACGNRLTGRRVSVIFRQKHGTKPDVTCNVCGAQIPWRYSAPGKPALSCQGACTKEAQRRRVTARNLNQIKK